MKKTRFTETQIVAVLKRQEAGIAKPVHIPLLELNSTLETYLKVSSS